MKRDSGFYWVVTYTGDPPRIAEYDAETGLWYITGNECCWHDNELNYINENRLTAPGTDTGTDE